MKTYGRQMTADVLANRMTCKILGSLDDFQSIVKTDLFCARGGVEGPNRQDNLLSKNVLNDDAKASLAVWIHKQVMN